jgi:NADPH:quinone reductase-like Zn-dependent oxidoreductase
VIATNEENLVDAVKRITSRKLAYAAVDCVAGELTGAIAAAVRPHGKVLVCAVP